MRPIRMLNRILRLARTSIIKTGGLMSASGQTNDNDVIANKEKPKPIGPYDGRERTRTLANNQRTTSSYVIVL
jgi:hypothetical protein